MSEAIQTNKAPKPAGPFSKAIVANGFVFCSGQVGVDPTTETLVATLEGQVNQIMKNLEGVLKASGSDLDHIVKTTLYLVDMNTYTQVNEVYGKYFPNAKPARTTIQVSKLPQGKLTIPPLIEIDAIATLI